MILNSCGSGRMSESCGVGVLLGVSLGSGGNVSSVRDGGEEVTMDGLDSMDT